VNVPQAVLDLSPLTAKDRRDLSFGLELGVDWVALSFVQRPQDIREARELIGDKAFFDGQDREAFGGDATARNR